MKLMCDKIRSERIKRNYTQEYIADEIGISQSQYSRIEKGEVSIDLERLGKLVRVLEINPFDIIEFSQNIENSPIVEKNSLEQIKILFAELIETLKMEK